MKKIVNAQGGSDARFVPENDQERALLDSDGRPLGAEPWLYPGLNEWTSGLPGAREMNAEGTGGSSGGGIPGGALIAQQLAYAKKAYENALAKITNQRQTLGRTSGYTFDVDPESGVMRSMRVDPQSLYGTFQMLNRQQADRDEAARGSAVERGLGSGGGLAAQLRSDAKFQSGQEDAQFSSSLIDTISQLALQQQDAKNAYDQAKWQAELDAARAAQPRYTGGGAPSGGDEGGGPVILSPQAPYYNNISGQIDAFISGQMQQARQAQRIVPAAPTMQGTSKRAPGGRY